MTIDKGYNLFVNYSEQILHLGLSVDAVLLNGDASAFWLRLSAFDNLAHSALGTKQQAVFDDMNKLSKKMARRIVATKQAPAQMLHSRTEKATIGATMGNNGIMILLASASGGDIDKMKQKRLSQAQGKVSSWRRILGLSLQAFAAGAEGYANAYQKTNQNTQTQQPIYRAPRTCYTDFIANSAFTSCY